MHMYGICLLCASVCLCEYCEIADLNFVSMCVQSHGHHLASFWQLSAAEATHETCLLINTTMNHFSTPFPRVRSSSKLLFRLICIYICMYACLNVCVLHYFAYCRVSSCCSFYDLFVIFTPRLRLFAFELCFTEANTHALARSLICARALHSQLRSRSHLSCYSHSQAITHTPTHFLLTHLLSRSYAFSLISCFLFCMFSAMAVAWPLDLPTRSIANNCCCYARCCWHR